MKTTVEKIRLDAAGAPGGTYATFAKLLWFEPIGEFTDRDRAIAAELIEKWSERGIITSALRSLIGEAFGLREQTAPDWMRPSVEVFQEGRGARGVWMKIVTVDGSIVELAHPDLGGLVERGIVGYVAQLQHREPIAAGSG